MDNEEVAPPEIDTNDDAANGQIQEFSKVGNLTMNNPGMKEGVWFLIHEEPGSPGVSAELQFDSSSQCEVDGMISVCDETQLAPGQRVEVEGEIQGDIFLVRGLLVVFSPVDDE